MTKVTERLNSFTGPTLMKPLHEVKIGEVRVNGRTKTIPTIHCC